MPITDLQELLFADLLAGIVNLETDENGEQVFTLTSFGSSMMAAEEGAALYGV